LHASTHGPNAGTCQGAAGEAIEARVAREVAKVSDVAELREWLSQAAAIEAYLRSRDLQRPMLGAQRRVEARIGQLMGEPKRGRPSWGNPTRAEDIRRDGDRSDFRVLANALSGNVVLSEDEWRKSRRALVAFLRRTLGLVPPHTATAASSPGPSTPVCMQRGAGASFPNLSTSY
jgi:hypothetical protein